MKKRQAGKFLSGTDRFDPFAHNPVSHFKTRNTEIGILRQQPAESHTGRNASRLKVAPDLQTALESSFINVRNKIRMDTVNKIRALPFQLFRENFVVNRIETSEKTVLHSNPARFTGALKHRGLCRFTGMHPDHTGSPASTGANMPRQTQEDSISVIVHRNH